MDEPFKNRQHELKLLKKLWAAKKAQFVVAYGRRRIGKTALLSHFSTQIKGFNWMAYRSTSAELLKDFSQALAAYLHPQKEIETDYTYGSWKVAFETLALNAQNRRLSVLIDEFPYLIEAEPSIPSILQAVWDQELSKTKIFFIISGSRMSMIQEEVLAPKGPLYGRSTAVLLLQPISYSSLKEFYPGFSPAQRVEVYGVTGGVPKYFEMISPRQPVMKSLQEAITSQSTFLTTEPQFLLHEEFRETRIYLAILRALGKQALTVKDLSKVCGVNAKALSNYLDQLRALQFVERSVPSGEDPHKSRKGRYQIRDPFLNFYFHFMAPYLQEIEQHRFKVVLENIKKNFAAYLGKNVFEKLCRDWLSQQAEKEALNFIPETIGRYWDQEMEIDLLGLNSHDRAMWVGVCKWTHRKLGLEVARSLEKKAQALSRKNGFYYQLIFFAKSGFSETLVREAKKKNYRLVDLEELTSS